MHACSAGNFCLLWFFSLLFWVSNLYKDCSTLAPLVRSKTIQYGRLSEWISNVDNYIIYDNIVAGGILCKRSWIIYASVHSSKMYSERIGLCSTCSLPTYHLLETAASYILETAQFNHSKWYSGPVVYSYTTWTQTWMHEHKAIHALSLTSHAMDSQIKASCVVISFTVWNYGGYC